jgi:membrane protease YdiL (CAAX protease family)
VKVKTVELPENVKGADSTSETQSPIPVEHPITPAPVNRRRWWIHLVLVSGYVIIGSIIGWGRNSSHSPALSHTVSGLLIVCAIELLFFALVMSFALISSRASRDDLLLRWRGGFLSVPLGIGYSIALRISLMIVMMMVGFVAIAVRLTSLQGLQQFILAHRPEVEVLVDISAMRHNPVYFWLVLTLVSFVVAGLREEFWRAAFFSGLRALWPRSFGSRWGQILAMAVAAVIFGIGHLAMGPVAVILAGLIGFCLGAIIVLHQSIWPAVIAHGVFDATSLALLPWISELLWNTRQTLG